ARLPVRRVASHPCHYHHKTSHPAAKVCSCTNPHLITDSNGLNAHIIGIVSITPKLYGRQSQCYSGVRMLNMHNFTVPLDRDSEEPIYRQLIRHIRAQIDSGSLSAGTRLPASRDLARQLNISRISVVNAYAELRAEG